MADKCPSLVVAIMLGEVKTLRVLQKFRLVSKYWNVLACNALKTNSIVRLIERDINRLRAFCSGVCNSNNSRPPSFLSFELTFESFGYHEFLRFALKPSVRIRRLRVLHLLNSPRLRSQNFCLLLATKGQYVEELEFKTESSGTGQFPWVSSVPRLPNVTFCSFEDEGRICGHQSMLSQILKATSCTKVQIRSADVQLASCLIESLNDICLKELTIEAYTFTGSTWGSLLSKRFSCLVSLNIVLFKKPLLHHEENMTALVSHLAVNMRSIKSNIPFSCKCPKLKQISIVEDCTLIGITTTSFPALKTVNFLGMDGFSGCVSQPSDQHAGVSGLSMDIHVSNTGKRLTRIDVLFFLSKLKRHFPNVQYLRILCCAFVGIPVAVVHQVFPRLKHLSINSYDRVEDVVGISSEKLGEHLNAGWKFEDIPALPGFSGFEELNTLSFGSFFEIESVLVLEWLLRIQYLRSISFYWSFKLDPRKVASSLTRLHRANIHGLRRSCAADILETFQNINCYYFKERLDHNVELFLPRANENEF